MKRVRIKRSRKRKEFAPPSFLPGMRGSADWHVRRADEGETPHTRNQLGGEAEMALPPADNTRNKFVRLHETLHAAHSPVEPPRPVIRPDGSFIRDDALIIAEEFRINMYGRTLLGHWENLPNEDAAFHQQTERLIQAYATSNSPSALVEILKWMIVTWPLTYRSFSPTTIVATVLHVQTTNGILKDREAFDLANFISNEIWYNIWATELINLAETGLIPSWDSVLKLGAFLSDTFNALEHPGEGESSDGETEDPDIQKVRARHPKRRRITGSPINRAMKKLRGFKGPKEYDPIQSQTAPQWGTMTTRIAKLTLKLPKNLLARSKYRATDEGANPRYPHRLLTDGKVFSRKKRSNGGSILIDDSGSMSWTTDELVAILEEAPAVNIAAYSGQYTSGELVILAANGKYANMELGENHPFGGNNLIDLPALEWLAAQPAPRLWVSDTMVTTVAGDHIEAFEQCIQLCKDYDINIVETPEEAGAIFRGEKEIYR